MSTTERVSLCILDHLGQPVQRLRTEHEIDERRPLRDAVALLAGDAAANADHDAVTTPP